MTPSQFAGGGFLRNRSSNSRWSSGAGFVQNDWKVSRNLTINLGVRYSLDLPRTEKYDNQGVLRPDLAITVPMPTAMRCCFFSGESDLISLSMSVAHLLGERTLHSEGDVAAAGVIFVHRRVGESLERNGIFLG